ncbi:MAG: HDIG domain-containing metalloprotein [Planctomycetota bacterium]
MSKPTTTTPKSRNRAERIESLGIDKPWWVQWWNDADRRDVLTRLAIATGAAIALLLVCRTWQPPFAYRLGAIPARNLVSRVDFELPNEDETESLRLRARREQPAFYLNRTQPLDQLRAALRDQLFLILAAPSFEQMNEEERNAFSEFFEGSETDGSDTPAQRFSMLKQTFAEDAELEQLRQILDAAMRDQYQYGVIQALQHETDQGSQKIIRVFPKGQPDDITPVEVSNARIAEIVPKLTTQIKEAFRQRYLSEGSEEQREGVQKSAVMISEWIGNELPRHETLQYDDTLSEEARRNAATAVSPIMTPYRRGESKLANAGEPLEADDVSLLRQEWQSLTTQMNIRDQLVRMAAYAGMIIALYLLCGSYIFFVDDRRLILESTQLAKLMSVIVVTIGIAYWASGDQWRFELSPLIIASILLGVVYGRELALLIMAASCLSLTLFLGIDLSELVTMAAACTSCILLLGRIRTRTHLLWVGTVSAIITMMTVIGVGIVTGRTLSAGATGADLEPMLQGPMFSAVLVNLVNEALRAGIVIVGFSSVTTVFLPMIEKGFGVQTDLSLLELGNPSDVLLRKLAQRAPGTYNHSINVASIAEAAADSIGANGLLVRVGAYYHDIGKMFKPEYFIENQAGGENSHDALRPAMSTLVIIAHVKDGADLARSHNLPQPIIDFIMQHHGTTLVEYFYREAAKRSESDPNGESVSDKDFRYPGPKPQTLEAAVMMLADTVESASRTLVDPTPARIRSLVDKIAEKKVNDGQFDECGLTFQELATVKESLIKSLTAIYHARVKYPDQKPA